MTIKTAPYQKGKVSVTADGELLFVCPARYWYGAAADFERDLTPAEYAIFIDAVVLPYCTERAVNLLRYRDHSAHELEGKLRRFMSSEISARVIGNLAEKSYLNDTAYARHTADRLSAGKRMSKTGIYRELIAKGIPRETAEQTVETLDSDEPATLDAMVSRALNGKTADEKFRRRLYNKMLRLGYSHSAAAAAIQRAKSSGNHADEYDFGGTDE